MKLPFSFEQFIQVFYNYNTNVWPTQILIYLLAGVAMLLLFRKTKYSTKVVSLILALLWLWMGIVYHWLYFSPINPVAKFFGFIFVLQGIIFLYFGVIKNKINFEIKSNTKSFIGIFLMVFGTVIYPLLGYYFGHIYPYSPTFGLPCPTTIFTLGVLLLGINIQKYILIIPFIWTVIGFMAALSLGITEDISLLISGLTAFILFFLRKA